MNNIVTVLKRSSVMFTSRDWASCVPRRGGVSLAISTGKFCQFCGKQITTAFFKVARSIQNSNETSEYPLNYHLFIFYLFIYCILLGRIYNCPEGKGTRGLQRPIRRCPTSPTPHLHTKDSHSTGITLLFSNSAWVLLRPTELSTFKELWDGTSGLSSLSEKTRKSNHLQMKLQRQHFLLSYLKTLSVGPVELTTSRVTARWTTKWATGEWKGIVICVSFLQRLRHVN